MRSLLATLLLVSVCGCTALLLGGGNGNDGAPASGTRTQGEIDMDARITAEVRSKLEDDQVLSAYALSVQTFKRRVTLRGAVGSASDRERAARLAVAVQGVTTVDNRLRVATAQ